MGMQVENIYYENELKHNERNNKQFALFLEDFYKFAGYNLDGLIPDDVDRNLAVDKFYYIKYLVLRYLPHLKEAFYQLLEERGYRMEFEIVDILRLLGDQESIDVAGDIVGYVLESPLVQEMEINGDVVGVTSDKLGTFRIIGSKNYFKDNLSARSLFMYGDVSNQCHQISTTLLHEIDDSEIVTALMPNYFSGTYYHSYIRSKDGIVIDGANQIVLPNDDYENLFKPRKIIQCKRAELYDEYMEAVKKQLVSENDGFYVPLAVALSKQLTFGAK